jgi:hypothetical protein
VSESAPGRPAIIETPAEFDRLVDEYRDLCRYLGEPVTFAGMAAHLGFASRQSFYDYEKRPDFSYSVKRARLLVEAEYEKKLSSTAPTGAIFALKNHGWNDKQQVEHSGAVDLSKLSDDELRAIAEG